MHDAQSRQETGPVPGCDPE